jgi:transposase
MLVNTVRGLVKSAGHRLPKCSTESFARVAGKAIPAGYELAARPLIEQVAQLTAQIQQMDQQIEALAKRYPEVERLRSVPGVGPIIATAYVLTLDWPANAEKSRAVGAFLGLRPRQSQSGAYDPQHRISKAGNDYLRRLLVQAAHYVRGTVRTGFATAEVEAETCRQRRQARQKASRSGGGSQAGGSLALFVVMRRPRVVISTTYKMRVAL